MKSNMSYFKTSFVFSGIMLGAAFMLAGWKGLLIATILSILEVSLSFDNAVVNAKVLKDMDDKWRHRFLTWGMVIAVFGMRIVFPLLIVSIVANMSPWAALTLAMGSPDKYAEILTSAHVAIAGFGGAFLMMVFLKFFFDAEKDVHWVQIIEEPLTKFGKIEGFGIAVTLLVAFVIAKFIPAAEVITLWASTAMGLVTYILVDGIGVFMEEVEDVREHDVELSGQNSAVGATTYVAKAGAASFLYLELLDASFSFDGVIGAFALSNNIFIIAIGLGIGAMFVRSLTLLLVAKGTLSEYRYLEHGAFYAIGALATIMFANVLFHIPEVVTGLIGAAFIGLALISSINHNKRDVAEEALQNA